MNKLFDFGSRPIRVIELKDSFRFVHKTEGWTIADTSQSFDPRGDEFFHVWDAESNFMGAVISFGNLSAVVSQIYDQQYGPASKMIPVKQPDALWVVFAEQSDGEYESATFSREVEAPDLETAEERFLSSLKQTFRLHETDNIGITTTYGPYMRA